jgi:DNA-binding NtrC family response regulator
MKNSEKKSGHSHDEPGGTRILEDGSNKPAALKQARLIVLKGKNAGKEIVLRKTPFSIGTLQDNDLVLTDQTVSRKHAVVEDKSGRYVLSDLSSTNGTFLDGVRVREAFLAPGSVIRLGHTEILFSDREEQIASGKDKATGFGKLFGTSPPMQELYGILERISPTDVTVLIEGETGTGKELAARAIHDSSRRRNGPFIVVDCGAVAPNLIESELFGHEKGAFTDAVRLRQGAFELAGSGTIFLDEIGELSLDLQPKLLRALDQREYKRVGAERPESCNVRVISATNRDLEKEVKAGRFREDLFYRLSVVRICMPPLRKRKEDIATLAGHMLTGISHEIGKDISGLSPEAAAALNAYSWPGNVRELKNILERAAALSKSSRIEARDLFLSNRKSSNTLDGLSGKTLEEIEKAAIRATLESVNGNKTEAAKVLGIAYSTLYEKMKKYALRE